MDIVEQIAKSVLPKVLSNPEAQTKESGLVSQFIALFATKIAGSEGLSLSANETGASIIQSVFPQAEERGELITKLAEVHDVDETTTQGLLAKAAPLVTGELNTLAGGTPLQTYLKEHLSLLGTKLPSWATSLIPTSILGALGVVGAGVAAVGGKAADIAGGAVDAVGDAAGSAVDAGKAVVGGTVDAVSNVAGGAADLAGSAVDKVGDVAGGAVDLAGDAVGKVGDLGAGAAGAVAGAAGATAAAGGSLFKKLLPLLGLIILGLIAFFLLKSCNKDKAPMVDEHTVVHTDTADSDADADAASTAMADEADRDDATLNISTGEGDELYTCNGHVGNQSLKDKIVGAVTNVFGSAEKCDHIHIDESYKTALVNEDKIQEALEAAKAVPNASLAIHGTEVAVDAKDPAARAVLVEKLQGILPGYTIAEAAPLNEEEVVAKGIEGSLAALNKLDNTASGSQIAKALNIQVINFATGKFEIPAKNKVVLDKAAELLTGNAAAKLAIIGHTDSTGDEAKNVALSNDRANAVKAYLVSKGAAVENLISKGVGSADPVATNATKAGRFQNRRISFDADANTFAEMMKGAASAVAGAAGAVVDGAADVAGAAADVTVDAGTAVVKGATDAANATVDAGKAVVGAAAAGTAAVANEVVEGAESVEGAMIEE